VDDAFATWLGLREPHDWAARDDALLDDVVRFLPASRPLRVVDLGTGTGSNLRYLVTRLPSPQEWLLVDKSPGVLQAIRERTADWAAARGLRFEPAGDGFSVTGAGIDCRARLWQHDLDLPLDPDLFCGRQLVTGSALLDLASEQWLRALAERCRVVGAAALFVLSYDGRTRFEPPEAEDDLARDLLNAHQLTDKGLGGRSVGPDAHRRAVDAFRAAGFDVREARTDWDVDGAAAAFQRRFVDDLAAAAAEQQPALAPTLTAWRDRRRRHIADGHSRVIVGHHDLAALPR
jgi:SAM-dependent methyltransferase